MNVVLRAARPKVQQIADIQQEASDRVLRGVAGRPIEDVKVMLRREIRVALGSELTDPELSDIAMQLAAGVRVIVRLLQARGSCGPGPVMPVLPGHNRAVYFVGPAVADSPRVPIPGIPVDVE